MRISHFYSWRDMPPEKLNTVLDEFVAAGIKFPALGGFWLKDMLQNPILAAQRWEALRLRDLCVFDVHSPYGAKWDLNIANDRDVMIANQLQLLSLLADKKIETYTFHIGIPYQNSRKMVFESLKILLPHAAKLKITLAIENTPCKGAGVNDLLEVIRYFDSEFIGVCFDSGHANLTGNPVSQCRNLSPYIVTCHLHDNFGKEDTHNLPTIGNINWKELIPVLLSSQNLKSIQNECAVLKHKLNLDTCRETFEQLFTAQTQ